MALGGDHVMEMDAAETVSRALHDYFAPAALGATHQVVARPPQYKRTAQTMGEYLAKFDLLRRKAEARMAGGAFPQASVSIWHMQNASLPPDEKSLVLATVQGGVEGFLRRQVRCDTCLDHWGPACNRAYWSRRTRGK